MSPRTVVVAALLSVPLACGGGDSSAPSSNAPAPTPTAGAAGSETTNAGGDATSCGASGKGGIAGSTATQAGNGGASGGNAGHAGTSSSSGGAGAGNAGGDVGAAGTAGASAGNAGTAGASAGNAGSAGTSTGNAGSAGASAGNAGSGGASGTTGASGTAGASGATGTLKEWDDVDDALPWKTCGSCANSGATGPTAYTELEASTAEHEDASSMELDVGESLSGAVVNHPPYGDAYWWKEHGKLPALVRHVDYWLDVYVPSTNHAGDPTTPQAIEFETQETIGNVVYDFAWQDDYSGDEWRIFQYGGAGNGKWISSGITGADFPSGSTKLAMDQWHSIHVRYSVDTSTSPATILHDLLEIDGVGHTSSVPVTAYVVPPPATKADQFSNAVQLDMRGVACVQGSSPSCQQGADGMWRIGVPFHVYWDRIKVVAELP